MVVHPLATSDHDEGSTEGNRKVLDDLLLNQLKMEKAEVNRLMVIVGSDQSTVEKLRTLKKFLESCPHGYSRYGWVLPLIQLWHMGWADLERVLSMHWGQTSGNNGEHGDMSSFYFTNAILKRKIKDVKRPDFYPTQAFIFDNLKVEILDCWKSVSMFSICVQHHLQLCRVYLETNDLDKHFSDHPTNIKDLLKLASQLVTWYLTTEASE
jgi:hypothetical protein